MTELGSTQDPQALIPGHPDAIVENSRILRARAERVGQAGDGLRSIDTGSWEGPAAHAFHDKFSYEPAKWFTAADALEAGAAALENYASTLRWAQGRAAEAIRLWNQGEAATAHATTEYNDAAARAVAQSQPIPPLVDAGEQQRQAARETLNRARAQLTEVGDIAAGVLRGEAEAAPKESSWLDDLGDGLSEAGARLVNGVASLGNAMLHHPGEVLAAGAGIGLTAVSAAGELTGVALDATGRNGRRRHGEHRVTRGW